MEPPRRPLFIRHFQCFGMESCSLCDQNRYCEQVRTNAKE